MCVCDEKRDLEVGGNAANGPRCSGGCTSDGGDLGDVEIRTFQCLMNLRVQYPRTAIITPLLKTQEKWCSPVAEIVKVRPVGAQTTALRSTYVKRRAEHAHPHEPPPAIARGGRERRQRCEIPRPHARIEADAFHHLTLSERRSPEHIRCAAALEVSYVL